jgi:hypothetical protein
LIRNNPGEQQQGPDQFESARKSSKFHAGRICVTSELRGHEVPHPANSAVHFTRRPSKFSK